MAVCVPTKRQLSCLGARPADDAVKSEDRRIQPGHGRLSRYLTARGRRAPLTGPPPRAPRVRTTPGCTCGHGSAPPTAPRPRAYACGGRRCGLDRYMIR